jgi:hypothetical protein
MEIATLGIQLALPEEVVVNFKAKGLYPFIYFNIAN